jgi:hypothetical protein
MGLRRWKRRMGVGMCAITRKQRNWLVFRRVAMAIPGHQEKNKSVLVF